MADKINFNGFYRGICVDNYDPKIKGRIKVHVPGVYAEELSKVPENLPWAEPVMPLWGGNWTNESDGCLNTETGTTTIPHTSKKPLDGAQLWIFFEKGDQNYPRYFAAVQGGDGWHSEHNNQHVMKTDNVRIRIDENPGAGTCKFNSYNSNNNHLSKKKQISQMPTRTDIEIWNEGGNAVNIIVKGSVNMKIDGDLYEDHTGDKHITHTGNVYKNHIGDIYDVHEGSTIKEHIGDVNKKHEGDKTEIHTGDLTYTNTYGNLLYDIKDGDYQFKQLGTNSTDIYGSKFSTVKGDKSEDIVGSCNFNYSGNLSVNADEIKHTATEDMLNVSESGNIVLQSFGTGVYDTKLTTYPNLWRGGIILKGDYIRKTAVGGANTPDDGPGTYVYRYAPTITSTVPGIWAIEDNTGNEIHHNAATSVITQCEYDPLQG